MAVPLLKIASVVKRILRTSTTAFLSIHMDTSVHLLTLTRGQRTLIYGNSSQNRNELRIASGTGTPSFKESRGDGLNTTTRTLSFVSSKSDVGPDSRSLWGGISSSILSAGYPLMVIGVLLTIVRPLAACQ